MKELTLYEIMGQDHIIFAQLQDDKEVHVVVTDTDEHEIVYSEKSHMFAWESLVSFAKQILACDERLRQEIEINE